MPSPRANSSQRRWEARATLLAVEMYPEAEFEGIKLTQEQRAALLSAVDVLEAIDEQEKNL